MKKILGGLIVLFAVTVVQANEVVFIGGEGVLVFINSHKSGVKNESLQDASKPIQAIVQIKTSIVNDEWSVGDAKKAMERNKATAAVFVVKDKTMPLSLIALEEKWGVVNAEGLSGNQLRKEVIRIATVVLGAASSKYPSSVLRPAFSVKDLDKVGDLITIDSLMAIYPNLGLHGFRQHKVFEYLDALEQGIAPPPVNEAQRKIKAKFDAERKK